MPHVVNTDNSPYNAIGLLHVKYGTGGGWGTASLIDSQHLLTCAHNVFIGGEAALSARFYRAYNETTPPEPSHGLEVSCAFIKRIFSEKHDRTWDIALLRLEAPVEFITPLRLGVVTEKGEPNREMRLAGYPGKKLYRMWEEEELVSGFDVPLHVFAYTHETETGVSGSPLYHQHRDHSKIYGVHSGLAMNLDDKVGVLITETTYDFLQKAINWNGPAKHFLVNLP